MDLIVRYRLRFWAFGIGLLAGTSCGLQFLLAPHQPIIPDLFDTKTTALVDLWVVGHLVFGIILAGGFQRLLRERHPPPWQSSWLLAVLSGVFVWEAVELAGELGFCGEWAQRWLAGIEFWFNRYLIDPAVALLGCWLWRRFPACFWPVVAFGLVFEAANLLAPTALTIQEWLVGLFI